MIAVALIEDNRLVRQGICALLGRSPDLEVVVAAGSGDTERLRAANPGVVLLDLGLRSTDSLRLTQRVKQELPEAKIIVMDLLPTHADIVEFVHAGADGFILKDASLDDLVRTIRSVAEGERVLPPPLASTLFSQIASEAIARGRPEVLDSVRMTPREREVIGSTSKGVLPPNSFIPSRDICPARRRVVYPGGDASAPGGRPQPCNNRPDMFNDSLDRKTRPADGRTGEGPAWSWRIGSTEAGQLTPLATSTPRELDRITHLTGESLDVAAVCATLVDAGGRLVASCYGLDVPMALLFTHALRPHLGDAPHLLVVDDATCDPRLANSPVVRDGTVRGCVGTGLRGRDGLGVGSLLLLDPNPRPWTPAQLDSVRELAAEIENGVALAAFAEPMRVLLGRRGAK